MIRAFCDADTEALFQGEYVPRFQSFRTQAERRLQILDSATRLDDLRGLPSNRFEALKGNRKGKYSIRINRQWRICFAWRKDGAYEVEITDYH